MTDVLTRTMLKEAFTKLTNDRQEPVLLEVQPKDVNDAKKIATAMGYPNFKIVRNDTGEEAQP